MHPRLASSAKNRNDFIQKKKKKTELAKKREVGGG
jgi:hypothetical protein